MGGIHGDRSHSASRATPASMTGPAGHRSQASRSSRSLLFVDILSRSIGLPAQVPGGRSAFRPGLNQWLSMTRSQPGRTSSGTVRAGASCDLIHTRVLVWAASDDRLHGPSPRLAKANRSTDLTRLVAGDNQGRRSRRKVQTRVKHDLGGGCSDCDLGECCSPFVRLPDAKGSSCVSGKLNICDSNFALVQVTLFAPKQTQLMVRIQT